MSSKFEELLLDFNKAVYRYGARLTDIAEGSEEITAARSALTNYVVGLEAQVSAPIVESEKYLTYSYTCRDGHGETETLTIDQAADAICEYRFRAEKAEFELAAAQAENARLRKECQRISEDYTPGDNSQAELALSEMRCAIGGLAESVAIRADDVGRVERVRDVLMSRFGGHGLDWNAVARAVHAAADGEVK